MDTKKQMTKNSPMNRSSFYRQKGVTTIEYGMLAAGIAVVIGLVMSGEDGSLTELLRNLFDGITETIKNSSATEGSGGSSGGS